MNHRLILHPAGEIAIKSRRTRRRFEQVLCDTLRRALARGGVPARVDPAWGRIYVHTSQPQAAAAVIERVFGIASIAVVAAATEADLDRIVAVGAETFRETVRGRTYAVRARVPGRAAGFSASDINRALGAALNTEATVNLDHPEVTVRVEVDGARAYLFADRRPGAGGLPCAVEGHAVVLFSGGFDSTVAAWRMLRRGVRVTYVLCNLGGTASERMVLNLARVLSSQWDHGPGADMHVVDFTGPVAALKERTPPGLWQVMLKRFMYRAADHVATAVGADALVTGEAVGQASSQTLSNLHSLETAAEHPVLRPVIGWDKSEIVAETRRMGTYGLSERIKEYCAIAPGKPAVTSDRARVEALEAGVDPAPLEDALARRRVVALHQLESAALAVEGLFVDHIPDGVVVLDLQTPGDQARWHWPGARLEEGEDLLTHFERRLAADQAYVVYCSHGTLSAFVAEVMQRHGFRARAFAGPASALRRLDGAET